MPTNESVQSLDSKIKKLATKRSRLESDIEKKHAQIKKIHERIGFMEERLSKAIDNKLAYHSAKKIKPSLFSEIPKAPKTAKKATYKQKKIKEKLDETAKSLATVQKTLDARAARNKVALETVTKKRAAARAAIPAPTLEKIYKPSAPKKKTSGSKTKSPLSKAPPRTKIIIAKKVIARGPPIAIPPTKIVVSKKLGPGYKDRLLINKA